MRSKVIKAADR